MSTWETQDFTKVADIPERNGCILNVFQKPESGKLVHLKVSLFS